MTAPVTKREMSVVYGSVTVGGTSDYRLDAGDNGLEALTIDKTRKRTVVRFTVLLADYDWDVAGLQAFNSAIAAIESGFTRPRQRLQVLQGPAGNQETILDLNPSTDSGIEVEASLRMEPGDLRNTGRSRAYRVEITSGNPADHTEVFDGEAGLQDFDFRVSFLPSDVRTLEVFGTYTKLDANNATAQYEAEIADRVAAITSDLTGAWERVSEERRPNLENSLIDFRRVYEEINVGQTDAASITDDPDVRQGRITVAIDQSAPGDTGADVKRLARVQVAFSCWLDKATVNTPAARQSKWKNSLLPWIIQHTQDAAEASAIALETEAVAFDSQQNRLDANLLVLAVTGGSVLQRRVTFSDKDNKGLRITPVWLDDDLAAYVFKGARNYTRTILTTTETLGSAGAPSASQIAGQGGRRGGGLAGIQGRIADLLGVFALGEDLQIEFLGPEDEEQGRGGGGAGGVGPAPSQAGFVLLEEGTDWTNLRRGVPPHTIDTVLTVNVQVLRLVRGVSLPQGGGGGSGGGTSPRSGPDTPPGS